MTFKETVRQDIRNTFMNFDEFGEIHKLNGQDVLVIVDENELTEREKRMKDMGKELHEKQLLFYVAAEDFGPLPNPGRVLRFDNEQYLITDAENEDGIYSISLEAVRL